ncbi:MAG: hypothetical protein A3E37_05535 [Candidatus Andersenbacteria bacterium RIFCSPHIGHO2_12_FULL_46_9]|nr:MAG: hypothetical protein A3B76_02530 [Candidatus Andersenbacteria bacterium RIFCSPHIGHO2_02_FULL_46_16]OGY36148.1 MAG: hypothetical protein A3I08_04840 [Candidatus Andersenbacteria bacterium RIFCSPLOWO2_02_FULL_46_11]OGY38031.1 MAG: hypothetical protein A3E37_05535 [Candidatus Andersenbacteria bacterium RIFCSPHIGHO2_12_FULL_46_9]
MKIDNSGKKVGMVGIGGSGMRGLAYLLSQTGVSVYGTDAELEATQKILKDEPFVLLNEELLLEQLNSYDEVIFSDAVPDNHLVRLAARKNSREINYQTAVGNFARGYHVFAITGTHGKSSTCAMAAHIMVAAGLDPTVLIGAAMREWGGGHARMGKSDILLLEADEYREHFLTLNPDVIAITSIDFDHPDYFTSLEHMESAYSKFIRRRNGRGCVITLKSVQDQHAAIDWPEETVALEDQTANNLFLSVPGDHMKTNGLIAMRVAMEAGAGEKKVAGWLASYSGIKRRFEKLGEWRGMDVISDYGHHPTEISSTIQGAREKYPTKKIVVLFEPHTQERLKRFLPGFIDALKKADGVILLPVFIPRGREKSPEKGNEICAELLAGLRDEKKFIKQLSKDDDIMNILTKAADKFAVAIAFSAGDLDRALRSLWHI